MGLPFNNNLSVWQNRPRTGKAENGFRVGKKNIVMTKEEVVSNVNSISATAVSGDVKTEFCKIWPIAKQALQLLIKVVPSLTFFINLVIAGGDALANKICGA